MRSEFSWKRTLVFALIVLAVIFLLSREANAQDVYTTPLMERCSTMGSMRVATVGGAVDLIGYETVSFRHPETNDRYEASMVDDDVPPLFWQLTDYVDYESATGAPLMQLNIDVDGLDSTNDSRFTVLVYEVDAETVAPAIWTFDWLFENESSEAAQHPNCGWYLLDRADLDNWLSEVVANVEPEPRGYIIFNGRVYR